MKPTAFCSKENLRVLLEKYEEREDYKQSKKQSYYPQ